MTTRPARRTLPPDAVLPPPGSPLGLGSWSREFTQALRWSFNPPPYPAEDLPLGRGETVLLIPGFLGGDWLMTRLRGFLVGLGYRVEISGIVFNAGPTGRLIARLEAKLADLVERDGPVFLVGQSLGGVLARHLARQHPKSVRGVVTLCTPIAFPVTTPLQPFAALFAPFHDRAWRAQRDSVARALPIPVTAIYSQADGIVDWRQCLQDEARDHENVSVNGAHMVIGSNPDAQRAVARALARMKA